MLQSNGEAVAAATAVVVNRRRIYYLVDIHDWQDTLTDECCIVIYIYKKEERERRIYLYDAYLY